MGLNQFIRSNAQTIRRIEDKQSGWWFIKPENDKVSLQQVKDKLMFYLWDSVFAKDRRPLEAVLSEQLKSTPIKLITYADFMQHIEMLMRYFENLGVVPFPKGKTKKPNPGSLNWEDF